MQITNISGVLALTESDLFERRLQTFVFKKGFANTPRGARQLITHKKILVNGNVVNIPSFLVSKNIEKSISLRKGKVKEKIIKEEKPEDENLEEEGK